MKLLKHKLSLFVASMLICLGLLVPSVLAAEGDIPEPQSSDDQATSCKVEDGERLNEKNCGIIQLVIGVTNALSAIAGVVIVGVLVWGGIQYSAAGADAAKVQAAKSKITNALIALLLLIFGYSLLQWLIPGGVLNGFGFIY